MVTCREEMKHSSYLCPYHSCLAASRVVVVMVVVVVVVVVVVAVVVVVVVVVMWVVRLELLAAGCQTSPRARTQCDQSRHPPQQNVDMQRPSEELCPELSQPGSGKEPAAI